MVRFETNRSLTGMGHESFASAAEAKGPRPAAVLARRFFESGQVSKVHVYGNIVTATLSAGASQAGTWASSSSTAGGSLPGFQYW